LICGNIVDSYAIKGRAAARIHCNSNIRSGTSESITKRRFIKSLLLRDDLGVGKRDLKILIFPGESQI